MKEIKFVQIIATTRHFDDYTENNILGDIFPFVSQKGVLNFFIDVENKKILNWFNGRSCKLFIKVVDMCNVILFDKDVMMFAYSNDYVPTNLDFNGESYDDYLDFNIDEDGTILNWENEVFNDEKLLKEYKLIN